jgi:RimJ/RimL family protein N-acetyltransferase
MPVIQNMWRFCERAVIAVRRHGARGAVARALRRLVRRLRVHERHFWYELDLHSSRPRRELPEGFALNPAEESDLVQIAALPEATTIPVMRRWRAQGHELWTVGSGGRVAFVCWIFRGRAPVAAAKGHWIDLPGTIACVEDSITAPAFRGRGIAPGAWCALADRLESEGVQALVTKVEDWNQPSLAAVAKAGFHATAEMTLDREWGRSRVAVSPAGGGTGPLLAELIAGASAAP